MSAISTLVSPSGSMSLASKKYHNVDGRSYECSIHSRPRDLSELGDKQKGSQAVAHVMFRVGQNSIKHTGTLGATAVGDNILSVDVDPIPVDHRAPETQVGEGFSVVAWVDSDKAYRAKVTEHGPDPTYDAPVSLSGTKTAQSNRTAGYDQGSQQAGSSASTPVVPVQFENGEEVVSKA